MKTKLFLILFAMLGLVYTSCSSDDDNFDNEKKKEVESAFLQLYPDVQKVSWEMKKDFFVAEFWRTELNAEAEAWFNGNAVWQLTETDIKYDALPQTVKDGFLSSEYANWHIDDVDMIERPNVEILYIIEVDRGADDYDLHFSPDGTLLKATPDVDGDNDWENLLR